MPCADLSSMEQDDNPLFSLVRKRMKVWNDNSNDRTSDDFHKDFSAATAAVAVQDAAAAVDASYDGTMPTLSLPESTKPQLKTLISDTPATAALEQFLLFAASADLIAMPASYANTSETVGDVITDPDDELPVRAFSPTFSAMTVSAGLPINKTLDRTRSTKDYLSKLAGVHDVTRGLARITAAN